ncbi:MAG: Zn-dependent protease with chaperone function [Planctomycetota bacterium]|nr:Zn-dependent protease with chaperone function [Planctomycetota bacterium]
MRTLLILLALSTASEPAPTQTPPVPPPAQARVPVPIPSEAAMRYYRSGVVLWFVGQAWLVFVPAVVLGTGLSARMRTLARKIGRSWFFTVGIFGVLYVALDGLLTMPLAYYAGYVRPHEYGLASAEYDLWQWLADEFKSLGVTASLAFVLLWLPALAIERLPRLWPFAVALGYVPIAFTLMFLAPLIVDPLFNSFGPMKDKALEARIVALADRAGIDGGQIFEIDKSKQTNTVNAYVKGFLGSKRIVLWDTLLKKLDDRQVLFVMGHEMGHYVLGHVVRTLLISTLGVLLLCLFLQTAGNALIGRYRHRWGFDRLSDPAALPLLLLLGNLFLVATSPIGMAYSRYQEHEADRFALELTHDNFAGASGFAALQRENLSNPRPGLLSKLWRSTHPPLGERIEFCNEYHPWETRGPLRYGSLFR